MPGSAGAAQVGEAEAGDPPGVVVVAAARAHRGQAELLVGRGSRRPGLNRVRAPLDHAERGRGPGKRAARLGRPAARRGSGEGVYVARQIPRRRGRREREGQRERCKLEKSPFHRLARCGTARIMRGPPKAPPRD